MIDQRGYTTCTQDLASAYSREAQLRHDRDHYLVREDRYSIYFVSSQAWHEGDTRCEVARGGDLLARETQPGRWVQSLRGRITVQEMSSR